MHDSERDSSDAMDVDGVGLSSGGGDPRSAGDGPHTDVGPTSSARLVDSSAGGGVAADAAALQRLLRQHAILAADVLGPCIARKSILYRDSGR